MDLVGHSKAIDSRRQTADPAMKNNKFVWWGIVWLQTSGVDCRPKRAGLQTCALGVCKTAPLGLQTCALGAEPPWVLQTGLGVGDPCSWVYRPCREEK